MTGMCGIRIAKPSLVSTDSLTPGRLTELRLEEAPIMVAADMADPLRWLVVWVWVEGEEELGPVAARSTSPTYVAVLPLRWCC